MKEFLIQLPQHPHLHYSCLLGDGIFDTQEIQQIILEDLHKLPVIKYNPKGSRYKRLEDVPSGNWRFFNPLLADIAAFHKKGHERTAVERYNGRLKDGTHVRRSNVRGLENNHKFVYFGILTLQILTLTLQYRIKTMQCRHQLFMEKFIGDDN